MKISAVLLAAGLSQRMNRDKLLLEYNGKSLLRTAMDLLSGLPVYERIIVTSDDRAKYILNEGIPADIRLLVNNNPERGLNGSIIAGVKTATGTHYLFLPADQPKLTLNDLTQILKAADLNRDKIIYPLIDSKPCSPTIFPERFKEDLLKLPDDPLSSNADSGARIIRDSNKMNCMEVLPECPENFTDIDIEEDYNELVYS